MERNIVIYQGDSLETYLRIKEMLNEHGTSYEERVKRDKDMWSRFLTMLFLARTATYGMNGEHDKMYEILVSIEDYDKARTLVNGIA